MTKANDTQSATKPEEERILLTRNSPFNSIVATDDGTGMITLHFGDDEVIQSIVKLGHPKHLELSYARVIPSCLAFTGTPQRLLIVGLGGGTLPLFFHSLFPELQIDVVEIDAVVVEVAKMQCGFFEDSRMRVLVEDGRDFIERSGSLYDVIILDSFSNDSIPQHLLTAEFLAAVRTRLAEGGIAVANVWARTRNPLFDDMLRTYLEVFEDLYLLDVPDRTVKLFVAIPRKQFVTRDTLIRRTREFSEYRSLPQDPVESVSTVTRADVGMVLAARVLRD